MFNNSKHRKIHTVTEPITVWKIVLHPVTHDQLVMRCVIPTGSSYLLENCRNNFPESKTTRDTYISNELDILQIGQWIVDSANIAQYVPIDIKNCSTYCGIETVYNVGNIKKDTGLWSYAHLWQTLWSTTIKKVGSCIKTANVDGIILKYDENQIVD